MIKNFDTYIKEDYFSKLANRKDTGEKRIENMTPLQKWEKEVKWIDMGTDVLWSSINIKLVEFEDEKYECDIESLFDVLLSDRFNEWMNSKGVRLIRKFDIVKLGKVIEPYNYDRRDKSLTLTSSVTNNSIVLPMEFDGYSNTPGSDYILGDKFKQGNDSITYNFWYVDDFGCKQHQLFTDYGINQSTKAGHELVDKGEISIRLVKQK